MAAPSSRPATSAFPASILPSSPQPATSPPILSTWSCKDDKLFEFALSLHDQNTHELWNKVSAMVPGKDPSEIRRHFSALAEDVQSIEADLVDLPNYGASPLVTEVGADQVPSTCESPVIMKEVGNTAQPTVFATGSMAKGGNGFASNKAVLGKPSEQERRKGIPWTEDEHRMFLLGLEKYGKGDWRSISRNFVISRTPTQVASHAQKYFIRLASMNKDKRRTSIHDITSVNNGDVRQRNHHPPITGQTPIMNHLVLGQPVQALSQQNSAGFGLYVAPVSKPIVAPTGSTVGSPIILPSPDNVALFSAKPHSPKPVMPTLLRTVPQAVYPIPQQATNH